jgi:hypothetical protein
MSPATAPAKWDPNSKLRQHFGLAMCAGEQFVEFIADVRPIDIYSFWPRRTSFHMNNIW